METTLQEKSAGPRKALRAPHKVNEGPKVTSIRASAPSHCSSVDQERTHVSQRFAACLPPLTLVLSFMFVSFEPGLD